MMTVTPMPCSWARELSSGTQRGGGGGYQCYPDLSLADAQRQVDFTIPTPAQLSPGLRYRGALVDSVHSVFLSYRGAAGGLGLGVRDNTPIGGSAVPNGSVQRVTVDGRVAYFVRGDYEDNGPGTTPHWNPHADDVELTWQQGWFTYDLTAGGLHLTAADMVRIAESVR